MNDESADIVHLASVSPYTTKDGSEIRELWHPAQHGGGEMSVAQAVVAPGARTLLHRHRRSEEIYHVVSGAGTFEYGSERRPIKAGDTVRIAAGIAHAVQAGKDASLVFLCCCTPAYDHDDTEIL